MPAKCMKCEEILLPQETVYCSSCDDFDDRENTDYDEISDNFFNRSLLDIVMTARGVHDEPLDGDAVDALVEDLRRIINIHEGNT
jgi:hypothetical protein